MQKKKIAIFIVSMYGGGAERVVSILLKHLQYDYETHLVLLDDTIEYEIPEAQRLHVLNKKSTRNPILNIIKIPLLARRYKKYLENNGITTSFSFLPRPNFIACFLKYLGWKGKVIINERTFTSVYYDKATLNGKIGSFLVGKLYPKADVITCNSKLIASDLQETFHIRKPAYTVIYNPIDIEAINRKLSAIPAAIPEKFTFITLGRLDFHKNQALLIKAAALLPDLNFVVKIVGKGDQAGRLKELIQEYKLEHKIELLPHTSNPFELLKNAGSYVMTSNFEGFPNAVLEALACGLPVIATDCKSGPREMLAPGYDIHAPLSVATPLDYGILTPVEDPGQMAAAMQMILQNASLRSEYASKNASRAKDFDAAIIMKEYKKLLESR